MVIKDIDQLLMIGDNPPLYWVIVLHGPPKHYLQDDLLHEWWFQFQMYCQQNQKHK